MSMSLTAVRVDALKITRVGVVAVLMEVIADVVSG